MVPGGLPSSTLRRGGPGRPSSPLSQNRSSWAFVVAKMPLGA